jgi:hypothetical protein
MKLGSGAAVLPLAAERQVLLRQQTHRCATANCRFVPISDVRGIGVNNIAFTFCRC